MSRLNKVAAERIHIAKAEGRTLARRMQSMDRLDADQVAALADDFAALFLKYPDVYPEPPVSVEMLRKHVEELRQADVLAKQAEAEDREASRKLDEARRTFEAALAEARRAQAKPAKQG
jgi:hypothetical protein